jgi:ligand-binding sensor domain-containing protein
MVDNTLFLATWGGLQEFDWNDKTFGKMWTKADGLVDTDIRSLFFDEETETLYIGTKSEGISRINNQDFLLPITDKIGLPSNFIRKIDKRNSKLFCATEQGLSVFIENQNASIPILEINLTEENGLTNRNVKTFALSNSHVFCGTEDGFSYAPIDAVSDAQSWQTMDIEEFDGLNNKINSISVNNDNTKIAIATTNGVLVASIPDFSTIEIFQNVELSGEESIYPVFWDDSDNLWLSYGEWNEDALMVENTGDIATTKISNIGLPNQEIIHFTFPEFGSQRIKCLKQMNSQIAAFTWGQGIYLHEGTNWQQYKQNCIVTNYITDMKLDKAGFLWIINGQQGGQLSNKAMKGVSALKNSVWTNYTAETSPLISNNISVIEIDDENRKWLGTWHAIPGTDWLRGIHIFNDNTDEWYHIKSSGTNGLLNYLVSDIDFVSSEEIWVSTYDGGIQIYNSNAEEQWSTSVPIPVEEANNKIVKIEQYENYSFVGMWYTGLGYWNGEGYPDGNIVENWHIPPAEEFENGKIYDFTVRQSNSKIEFWVASANGLFMFDGNTWFRYGTVQKKQFLSSYNNWQPTEITQSPYNTPEYWYVEGQERLFASVTTFPRVIYVDIYNRLWIGTQDNGFTIYSPEQDTYKTYNQDNAPLLSNTITSFEYDPDSGLMFIGTENGLNSVEIGFEDNYNPQQELLKTIAYPNPYHPDSGFPLKIINDSVLTMPQGKTKASIFDINGQLVQELEKDNFQEFSWDGTNKAGNKCSSGIYLYVISTEDRQISRGKIILIR